MRHGPREVHLRRPKSGEILSSSSTKLQLSAIARSRSGRPMVGRLWRQTRSWRIADRPRPASAPTVRAHQAQRLRGRRRRHRHIVRPVEIEAGILDHLGDAVPGMHAREPKAPARAVEIEQAAVGDERDRAAGAKHIVGAAARRADEIDLRHQRAARMLDAEQDHFRHDVIEIGRAERAGKARLRDARSRRR